MTTLELVERVRDMLADYGDIETTAAAELTSGITDTDTEFFVDDASLFDTADWLYCDWEVMECKEATTDNTLMVRRGLRGSTAVAHSAGAVIRSNMRFSPLAVLNALNGSLGGAYPMLVKIVEDTSLSVVADQQEYDITPGVGEKSLRDIRSIWLESNAGEGDYQLCRVAVPITHTSFMLYGAWTAGTGIKVIGITTFDRLEIDGDLDTDYPDEDEAYEYLVKDAAGRLLMTLAAAESTTESAPARGTQAQDTRYVLLNASKALRFDARESLRKARMQLPVRIVPRPDARYF